MNCKCGNEMIKAGTRFNRKGRFQRYKCKKCGKYTQVSLEKAKSKIISYLKEIPKPIETPNERNISGVFENIRNIDDFIKEFNIDTEEWAINKHKINFYGSEKNPNFQMNAEMVKINPTEQRIPTIKQIKTNHKSKQHIGSLKCPDIEYKKSIVIGDAQIGFRRDLTTNKLIPFHDRKALNLTLEIIGDLEPDEVIIAGDMLDLAEAGKYTKEPEFYFTIQPALIEYSYFLEQIRNSLPNAKIVYLLGNHEKRLQKSIVENMLFAYNIKKYKETVPALSLRNLLSLDDMDIDVIEEYPGGEYWINDRLRVIHGETTKVSSELNNSKICTIMGHIHKIIKEYKTSHYKNGVEKIFVESIGCLCDITGSVPGVKKNNNWQQSILLVETYNEKYFNTQQIVYHSGVASLNGNLYVGTDNTKEIEDMFKLYLQ